MKTLLRAALVCAALFLLLGLGSANTFRRQTGNSGTITVANSASLPAGPFTTGSYVSCSTSASGIGSISFAVNGAYVGQFHVFGAVTGPSGTVRYDQIPDSWITSVASPSGLGVLANTGGTFTCPCVSGTTYVVCTALSSGTPTVMIVPGATLSPSQTMAPVISNPYGAALTNYEFAGVSSGVNFYVQFLDAHFVKVGSLVTYNVPVANPGTQSGITFATIAGGSLPSGAVYAMVRTDANCYWDAGAASPTDFKNNTGNAPMLFAVPAFVIFGGLS